jgi:hypothetical protein
MMRPLLAFSGAVDRINEKLVLFVIFSCSFRA